RIRQEGPLRTQRRAELLARVVVIGGDGCNLCVSHRDLRVKRSEILMLLVLLGTVIAASQRQDQRVIPLNLTQLADCVRVVGQLVVGKNSSGHNVRSHDFSPSLDSSGCRFFGQLVAGYCRRPLRVFRVALLGWTSAVRMALGEG